MTEILFILSIFMIFYIYLGYPCAVFFLSFLLKKELKKEAYEPAVSILIAAYNEEDVIGNTLKNKLSLDYPKEKLEIIVISDGSTDRTDEIVKGFEKDSVKLIRQEPRAGKTSGLNMAVPKSKGDILVFSDANSMYSPDSIRKLVRNFTNQDVGYVTGKMIYTDPDGTPIGDGCSSYMKYENFLRHIETKIGSVVGVDGGIDAVRKSLFQSMRPDQLPDFVLPLKVVEQGFRVVYEPDAILKESSLKSQEDEYKMRVRVSLRSYWALYNMRKLLSIPQYGLFAWQLWSHKVLRYLCFLFMFTAYFTNLLLLNSGTPYVFLFIIQSLLYILAPITPLIQSKGYNFKILSLINYFVLLNLASAHAFIKFLFRQKQAVWEPRKG